ncbi:MAG: PAS domain S-box protein [Labilithrix sp.]|nr:PAS domain S-box protein [Labilithrix sp.]
MTSTDDADLARQLAAIPDPLALLQGLFAHSPVPYVLFDVEGHPVVANAAYRAMFGSVPPPEYSVLRDEIATRAGLADAVRRAFAGETVRTPTLWYDPKELEHVAVAEANRVAIACTFFPLRDAGGGVAYVAVAYKDVTAELTAQERARENEERLRATLEATNVGTWEWTLDDDRVEWSPNVEKIFGLAPGRFAGTYEAWLALVLPEDRGRVSDAVTNALAGADSYAIEFRFVRPDGTTGWQRGVGHVVRDERGDAKALRGVVLDVTEQVEARRRAETLAEALQVSETRYRVFVSQSTEGIWRAEVTSPIPVSADVATQVDAMYKGGFLAECNDAMARMYGYDAASALVGARIDQLLVRDDPQNVAYLRAFVESGYRLEGVESVEVDRHGARRIFSNSLVGVVEDGFLLRAWGTQRDVTAEVEARRLAESANRAKDEFLAMLGHELRNPLAPIVTAIELMKLRGDDTTFRKERDVIERQVRHVVRLVDDLLDVSRVIRGKVALARRPVEIAECIAAGVELAGPLLEQRGHELAVEAPSGLVVDGDPIRLAQVFGNLLNNAAKYTPPGGHVRVLAERAGAEVRVTVRDDGVGIRPEILPAIFEPFTQEQQARDRAAGGLGLGLAIVRSLVTLHGGTVEARSEGLGRGAELSVSLPRAAATSVEAEPRGAAARDDAGARVRVLVVDDNEDAAELLADALRGLGHDVTVAHDAASALRLLDATKPKPRIGLLDLGLPDMDGFELARRIRAAHAGLPLVAVTGYGQETDRSAAAAAGFADLLVKPASLDDLATTIRRLT